MNWEQLINYTVMDLDRRIAELPHIFEECRTYL